MTITLNDDGTVEYLDTPGPLNLPLSNPVRQRVSTIRPTCLWKRCAFVLLRAVAGDRGRVAAFTRTWAGPWTATILATGQTQTTTTRAQAIAWEIEQLQ